MSIQTKSGFDLTQTTGSGWGLDSRPEHIREVVEQSQRRPQTLHPISALQSGYSLFERGVQRAVLPACRAFVAVFSYFAVPVRYRRTPGDPSGA